MADLYGNYTTGLVSVSASDPLVPGGGGGGGGGSGGLSGHGTATAVYPAGPPAGPTTVNYYINLDDGSIVWWFNGVWN